MSTRQIEAILSLSCLLSASLVAPGCQALLSRPHSHRVAGGHRRRRRPLVPIAPAIASTCPPSARAAQGAGGGASAGDEDEDDEALLRSVDASTLRDLCEQHSLPASGTKEEMLARLRGFAREQADLDRERRRGRTQRVEANLEGKARHTIVEEEGFAVSEEDEEEAGYFYYAAPETEDEKRKKEEDRRKRLQLAIKKSQSHITAPPPPENVKVNEKGERVVTLYSTTDKNDLTGVTSSAPQSDMSMENARYQERSVKDNHPEESLVGGPFGDNSGSRRKKADANKLEEAKEAVREVLRNLLATTGAPAFQDSYEEGDELTPNEFSSPYGFTGFQPERISPDLLSRSSAALRTDNGGALKEVLDEYELQAIGHDGMAADDVSKGGGHYREVTKVGSFLEGFRKAEERRVARETSTILLDRLVREGVKGLDSLLAGMVREGSEVDYVNGEVGAGELNGALVRYLEEAIREQEKRVKNAPSAGEKNNDINLKNAPVSAEEGDVVEMAWNITRGDDGTIVETIDPGDPAVSQVLREELEKTTGDYTQAGIQGNRLQEGDSTLLDMMTVQEKMLLLLKLLRDRVKVEAMVGNDAHARNLRVLAYCLKAGNEEEREKLILEELGNSLDVSASIVSFIVILFWHCFCLCLARG